MEKIEDIKKNLERSIRGRKAVLLFTGDKGSTLLVNIIDDMDVKAVFVNTGFHFDEILNYTKTVINRVETLHAHNVAIDSSEDMCKCCNERKVKVLKEYLSNAGAECLIVPFIREEKKYGVEDSYLNGVENIEIIKPLADLSERDVWMMIKENKIPFSSIYNKGYRVVDCKCCTTRIGRKKPNEESAASGFDTETVEKLKSLGYM